MRMRLKSKAFSPLVLITAVLVGSATIGCESSTTVEDYYGVQSSAPFDPSKPVTITEFTPTSGSVGQQICIKGSNFGNDTSQVHVKIGGKDAVVVSCRSEALYAYVPSAAYDQVEGTTLKGSVSVEVGGKTGKAAGAFTYERKMVVGRLCGKFYERESDVVWADGSYASSLEGVSGFKNDGVMQFSPYNHDHLFIVYDQEPHFGVVAHGIQSST